MLENIEVGAMGWSCGDAFPEDLPEDWQLDWYANWFSAVLVPHALWRTWDEAAWEAFLESADTLRWIGFGVREPLAAPATAALERVLNALAERGQQVGLASHVDLPDMLAEWPVTWFDRPEMEAQWRWRHLSGAPLGWAVTVPETAAEQRALLEDFSTSLPTGVEGAPFIVRDGCANMSALKQFKQLVELMGL
ncbi:hypothetical protein [Sulfurivirga sp.]|uniref:hypothetical protein n=1 Tax=Sulfurivirga sp. TaxID=2614236 RepID=UPI0025E00234|nr:hypothetical protein [Sulfurivirga sp.]